MSHRSELPARNPEVSRWHQIESEVDASLRASHAGQLPHNPEGQQIGYSEERRGERASRDAAALIKTAQQQPELYEGMPEIPPVIIEGHSREPEPPASEQLMDLIRTTPRHNDRG